MALRLRVNEAIARSEANGKKVLKKDIQPVYLRVQAKAHSR